MGSESSKSKAPQQQWVQQQYPQVQQQQQQQYDYSQEYYNEEQQIEYGNSIQHPIIQHYQQQQFQPIQSDNNAIYKDDEEIDQKAFDLSKTSVKQTDLEKMIQLSVTSLMKALKLSSKQTQTLPIQAQIQTLVEEKKFDNNARPNIDLICVIDKSGSMTGDHKMGLVVKTLLELAEVLGENDRLSLVQFDSISTRLLPLTRVSLKNKSKIVAAIQTLRAGGNDIIAHGMDDAFRMIRDRRFKNQVTSIFLLSDGQDVGGYSQTTALVNKYNLQDSFTINCFGFGADHDPVCMNNISKLKDGSFYYVEKFDQIYEMFADALGGLFSVVAQDVRLNVKVNPKNKIFSDVIIKKTYGDMWKYDQKTNTHYVVINQLLSGVPKEFLFEVEIPPINANLQDFERNASFIEVTLSAKSIGGDKTVDKQAELQLALYNESEQIVPEINEDVQLNVLRVQGAEAMEMAKKEADKGNYDAGQKIMMGVQQKIKESKPQQQEKLQMLWNDLSECQQSCQSNVYNNGGNIKMITNQRMHMEKRSKAVDVECDMYQNFQQKEMVNYMKSKK